ncbi:Tripartite motif-containing protein 38, partial [Heterocephalus glaber]
VVAPSSRTKMMKEMATCSICLNLMTEPVSISCGHSYCQVCMEQYLSQVPRSQGQRMFCPLCQASFHIDSIWSNKQLGNLIELIKKMEDAEDELVCEPHRQWLHLFCEEDSQLICWCWGPQHQGHVTVLVEDVCRGYKFYVCQWNLLCLYSTLFSKILFSVFTMSVCSASLTTREAQRQKIKSDFENLRTFLHEEEKSCLWRLEKEEGQILSRLRESEANLQQKSDGLKSHILELEAKCQSSAQKVLEMEVGQSSCSRPQQPQVNATVAIALPRVSSGRLQPPANTWGPGFLLTVAVGCSQLPETSHQLLAVGVALDPNTAHPHLFLSKDQTQVSYGCSQQNLEFSSRRFTTFPCVLGCEGFTSGKHYFKVDVGEGTPWDVGVCMDNVERGLSMKQKPEFGFWAIQLCTENGYVALTSPHTALKLHERPLVVGAVLDYEAGAVSFYNMTGGSHIFTFPKASFSDTLQPYFQVYQYGPLFLPSC